MIDAFHMNKHKKAFNNMKKDLDLKRLGMQPLKKVSANGVTRNAHCNTYKTKRRPVKDFTINEEQEQKLGKSFIESFKKNESKLQKKLEKEE